MKLFTTLSIHRLVASGKGTNEEKAAGSPLKPSTSSSSSSRWQRRVPFLSGRSMWRNSASSSSKSSTSSMHPPDPFTSSSSASASSGAEYSYHDHKSTTSHPSSIGPAGGLSSSFHELRSIPSMGESVLGVYLETSRSEDSLYFAPRQSNSARPPREETTTAASGTASCARVSHWVRQWKETIRSWARPPPDPATKRPQVQRRRPRQRPTRTQPPWRSYYSRACRKPLAAAVHSHEEDDEGRDDDDDDVDSLQASAHFSISCLSHGRNAYAMERLPWDSHDDDVYGDDDDKDDEFAMLRGDAPTITTTAVPLRPSSSSSTTTSASAGMTLDSYLSRHNPHAPPSKASKATKTTKTTAASTTLASGVVTTTTMDIAHVDTSDNQSVHSEMVMAVSFDHDYAQLVLTATAQELDDDDDDDENYDDDELASVNDELLGIAHSHPAAEVLKAKRCPSPPPSFVRGENKASAPRYTMRHGKKANGTPPMATSSHRPRNPWRDMVVADDDDGAGSFRGVEEWSVAAASVLIETTLTDWGESRDEDDDSVVNKPASTQEGAVQAGKPSSQGIGAPQQPPRRSMSNLQCENDDIDEVSFHSSDSECPFDERAWKAPHLRSAQPGRPSQFTMFTRSGSKRNVQLVGV